MAGRGSAQQRPAEKPATDRKPKWEKVATGDLPPFWEPRSKGDSVEGPIVSIRPNQFGGKTYTIKDGKRGVLSLRDHSFLQNALEGIEPGLKKSDMLRVTFTGEEQGANGKYFTYDVEYARQAVPF